MNDEENNQQNECIIILKKNVIMNKNKLIDVPIIDDCHSLL